MNGIVPPSPIAAGRLRRTRPATRRRARRPATARWAARPSPALGRAPSKRDLRAVRRVGRRARRSSAVGGGVRVDAAAAAGSTATALVERPQHVARLATAGGTPSMPGDRQRRLPRPGDELRATGSSRAGRVVARVRERLGTSTPRSSAASATAWRGARRGSRRAARAGACSPVSASSIRSSRRRSTRNDDGTTPPAEPECTPSVSTSTRRAADEAPRSDVVTHSRS